MLFKPAELTPLTAVKLAEVFAAAGLPDGLFQVVQGGADTGRLLTRHPQIRKISLTGEVGTGKAVMADAVASLKQVTLELGGKSPLIVFGDAKLDGELRLRAGAEPLGPDSGTGRLVGRERGRRGGRAAGEFLFRRGGVFERHTRIRPPQYPCALPRTPVCAHRGHAHRRPA